MAKGVKTGRPKATDKPDVVSKLVASFHSGLTVRQACWQSGISHDAFYARMRDDADFSDTMTKAQAMPSLSARSVITQAIAQGDVSAAKWWLERRDREDFGKAEQQSAQVVQEEEVVMTEERTIEVYETYKTILAYQYRSRKMREVKSRLINQEEADGKGAMPSSVTRLYGMSDDEVLELAQQEDRASLRPVAA